jgi:hypothetical protein
MKKRLLIVLAAVVLFSGCDAIKGLFGEDTGSDDSGGSGVAVSFNDIAVAAGGTTTLVSLFFDKDIEGLSDADITVDGGGTGATGGTLVRTGPGTYALAVLDVGVAGEIAVRVAKSGWNITPASQTAQVNYNPDAVPVILSSVIPDGTAGSVTTTAIALTFNTDITLQDGDITLAAGSTGAVRGNLTGSGKTYALALSGITAAGQVTVTMAKTGYAITPAISQVTVHLLTPLATGGTITYDPPMGVPDWEIHTFTYNDGEPETLAFSPSVSSVTADYLIVAGGGGAGGDNGAGQFTQFDYAGGGGAGGLLYKTGGPLSLQNGSVAIVVGAGGAGGVPGQRGANGGLSAIGSIEVHGGGGGGAAGNINMNGVDGGSGGGGASSGSGGSNTAGSRSSDDTDIQGHSGGVASTQNSWHDGGGGGGGAGSPGGNGSGNGGRGTGGNPWNATDTGAPWIQTAAKTNLFSRGGDGGGTNAPDGGSTGANYGDGGSGGKSSNTPNSGGSGHDGIVVIRFPWSAVAP